MELREWTYRKLLEDLADRYGDQPAFTFKNDDISFNELKYASDAFAQRLIRRGLKPGEHVALWGYNSITWIMAYYGIIKAGGVAVCMSYGMSAKEAYDICDFCDVRMIAFGNSRAVRENYNAAFELGEKLGISERRVVDFRIDYHGMAAQVKEQGLTCKLPEDDSRRSAVIMFTSGTSSFPKAVMLSQYALINQTEVDAENIGPTQGNGKALVALPLFHSYGMMVTTIYLIRGENVFILEDLKTDSIVDLIGRYRIGDVSAVATIYLGMIDVPDFATKAAPYIKSCWMGGGVLLPSNMIRLEQSFYNAEFIHGYGQTETAPLISTMNPGDPIEKHRTTVGHILDHTELRIWDPEKGFLPTGQQGEMCYKGFAVMNGYYKIPQDQWPIDADGWLHTGDLGFLDEEGFVHIMGRVKDIIIRKGENISPSEVEREILQLDGVKDAKVMGAPHTSWGESVECCVVLAPGVTKDWEAVRKSLRQILAPYKIPDHFFEYEALPLLSNSKLDVRSLRSDLYGRLQRIHLEEALEQGLILSGMHLGNYPGQIAPATAFVAAQAEHLGAADTAGLARAFEKLLTKRIAAAVEPLDVEIMMSRAGVTVRIIGSGEDYDITGDTEITALVSEAGILRPDRSFPVYYLTAACREGFDAVETLAAEGVKKLG